MTDNSKPAAASPAISENRQQVQADAAAAQRQTDEKNEKAVADQQARQKLDSPEEQARKSVAQGGAVPTNSEETELSASRSRTQNPSGGHTPEQLQQERKSEL